MLTTFRNKLSGFTDSLAFSNRWPLVLQRMTRPGDPIVAYCWQNRWWLVCDRRLHDAQAAKEVLAKGCYSRWVQRSVRDGRLAYVNVGANIGAFDVAVAAAVSESPEGLSIELNPHTFARLSFNLEINGLRHVRTLHAGVARERGTFAFRPSDCSLADGLFASSVEGGESVAVPLLTLDEAIARAGMSGREFDLLKLDCEGAEYGVVGGASSDCLRRFRNVVAELHPEPAGESADALYTRLAECGFRSEAPQWKTGDPAAIRFWSRIE